MMIVMKMMMMQFLVLGFCSAAHGVLAAIQDSPSGSEESASEVS